METDHIKYNNRLREARKSRGLTQQEVASEIGTSALTINRWEQGKSFPQSYYLQKLCDFFGLSAEELGFIRRESSSDDENSKSSGRLERPVPSQSSSSPSDSEPVSSMVEKQTETASLDISIAKPPSPHLSNVGLRPLLLTRRTFLLLILLVFLVIVTSIGAGLIIFSSQGKPTNPPLSSHSISVIQAPDGELIGISDGTFAFDTARPDGGLKQQAAAKFRAGDVAGAKSLWEQALRQDTNDAEALIYLEDQRVLASGHPYITFVIGTVLTGGFANTGRDSLQGAYIAQQEYNDQCLFPHCIQVRLLIANSGSGDSSRAGIGYASLVMEQIVRARQADSTILGVMGWPLSSSSFYASSVLGSAHIPIVSPSSPIDSFTQTPLYFFSVAPSLESEGSTGAQYAQQALHAKRVALFVDPVDPYSERLADAFSQKFIADGNTIVVTENYTVGQPETLLDRLQSALSYHPDLIYFAGHAADLGALLANLPDCGSSACVKVLGGDALYELASLPISARSHLQSLYFTAFAYPGEWGILAPTEQQPAFFSEYPQAFDPQQQHPTGSYGYTRADNNVILSYDAMSTLLNASNLVYSSGKQRFTPSDLQQALTQITGSQAWQGVSGRISFGPDGNPSNKVVLVLHWDQNISIGLEQAYGCFLKPLPTASPSSGCS